MILILRHCDISTLEDETTRMSRNVGNAVSFPRRMIPRNQRNWLKHEPGNGLSYVDFRYRIAKGRRFNHGLFTCTFSWAATETRVPGNRSVCWDAYPCRSNTNTATWEDAELWSAPVLPTGCRLVEHQQDVTRSRHQHQGWPSVTYMHSAPWQLF